MRCPPFSAPLLTTSCLLKPCCRRPGRQPERFREGAGLAPAGAGRVGSGGIAVAAPNVPWPCRGPGGAEREVPGTRGPPGGGGGERSPPGRSPDVPRVPAPLGCGSPRGGRALSGRCRRQKCFSFLEAAELGRRFRNERRRNGFNSRNVPSRPVPRAARPCPTGAGAPKLFPRCLGKAACAGSRQRGQTAELRPALGSPSEAAASVCGFRERFRPVCARLVEAGVQKRGIRSELW